MKIASGDFVKEKEFMAMIVQLADLFGWRHYHTYDSRRSVAGFPDMVLCRGERLIFAELKTDKGRVSKSQQEWLDDLRKVSGIEIYLWRPSDWDEIVRILR